MTDQFLTLESPTEGYYMERGSKFLAYVCPVQTEEDAQRFLQIIKKDHPKARHYCTALRLFPDASLERYNDDGEPSGSAGRPILGQLIKANLTNICLVVVRYFGGTKLGIPGLIEAYKTSAANAIDAGTIAKRMVYAKVMIHLSYENFPHFLNHCKQNEIPVFEESFGERASIVIGFPKSSVLEKIMRTFHHFSQMDFNELEDYTSYLNMEVEILAEEQIM